MTTTATPVFVQTPYFAAADLTAATACTTRAPTADATMAAGTTPNFAKVLTPVSTNGLRIDSIQVQAASTAIGATTAAQLVQIWMSNGTMAYLIDEISVAAQATSTTATAFVAQKFYNNPILVPAGNKLYCTTTVTTTASTTALQVMAFGGAY